MDDNFDKLRRALLGSDIDRLNFLQVQLNDRETFKSKVAENLTAATTESHTASGKYSYALMDPVIRAIGHGSTTQPNDLAKSLGPVMLPAISQAVAVAVAELKNSMEEMLTSSFTLKGFRWRREAARTGLPFGTIALRHTMKFQAEHVFLASKRTGAIISDVLPTGTVVGYVDPESTHGKYRNAVKQLALSAVITRRPEDVQTMPAGDSNIHVAHSAWATLALVTWGEANLKVKAAVQATLDKIEHEYSYEIKNFAGDSSVFEAANLRLKTLLDKNLNQAIVEKPVETVKKATHWKTWLLLATLLFAALCTYLYFEGKEKKAIERTLANEPAFIVGHIKGRLGQWTVEGLADPIGFQAEKVVQKAGLKANSVVFQTKPFLSLDPGVVILRARSKLLAPDFLNFSINPKTPTTLTLSSSGKPVQQQWLDSAIVKAMSIPGIDSVDTTGLQITPAETDKVLLLQTGYIAEIQALKFEFSSGLQFLDSNDIDKAVKLINLLTQSSSARNEELSLTCLGHVIGDSPSSIVSQQLMKERAATLCTELANRGVAANLLKQQAATVVINEKIATLDVAIRAKAK